METVYGTVECWRRIPSWTVEYSSKLWPESPPQYQIPASSPRTPATFPNTSWRSSDSCRCSSEAVELSSTEHSSRSPRTTSPCLMCLSRGQTNKPLVGSWCNTETPGWQRESSDSLSWSAEQLPKNSMALMDKRRPETCPTNIWRNQSMCPCDSDVLGRTPSPGESWRSRTSRTRREN